MTGGARGLGRAIAERLAGRGLTVLVTDIDGALAAQAAREIGRGAEAAELDVRDPAALRSAAAEASERGRLAVWVNNAGVVRAEPVTEHADEDVDLLVATNLLGVVNGSRAAIERMRADGGGRILNVASLSALTPAPGLAVYGATKHGVLAFSVALQAELRHAGLPVEVREHLPRRNPHGHGPPRPGDRQGHGPELVRHAPARGGRGRGSRGRGPLRGSARGLAPRLAWRAIAISGVGAALAGASGSHVERLGEWNRRRWTRGA